MNTILQSIRHLRDMSVELFRSSAFFRWTTIVSAVLVVLTFALPMWRLVPYMSDQQFIPLHYNIYVGVDRFGPWQQLFVLPVLGLVLLIVNFVFESLFFEREELIARFFAIATVFAQIVLFAAMVFIVLLNV